MDTFGQAFIQMYKKISSPMSLTYNLNLNVTSPTDHSNNFLFLNILGIRFL